MSGRLRRTGSRLQYGSYLPPVLRTHRPARRRAPLRWWAAGALLGVMVLAAIVAGVRACRKPEEVAVIPPEPEPEPAGLVYTPPTDQANLLDVESAEVFMPTASGRVQSAHFGSTRTVQRSGRLVPSFHEGIDIAPMRRDRTGRPLDDVYAVADGRVGYINAHAGNSTYGIYVVLLHDDPVGEIYTLYGHLASVAEGLRVGRAVERGETIGRMGNTSTLRIPMVRAHLHFEIGTLMNRRFDRWLRARGLPPNHGRFHGWNLRGIDPVEVYRAQARDGRFSLLDWAQAATPAFEVVLRVEKPLDVFERHPRLWSGPRVAQGAIVLSALEGGFITAGRAATPEEEARLGRDTAAVLRADPERLGRNARRIVTRDGADWTLGRYGREWVEKLVY